MKLEIVDLEGDTHGYQTDGYAFTNQETHSLPPAFEPRAGKSIVLVNVNGYSSMKVIG